MEKCNYPVKYALLPVKEYRTNKMGNEYLTPACHVVAKAYVVEEYKRNNRDGSSTTSYKVCFPHIVYSDRVNHFRKDPDSPLARDNEIVVSQLFDTYEEAAIERDKRNALVPEYTLEKYKGVEEEILELSKDLVVERSQNNNKIAEIQKLLLENRGVKLSEEEVIEFLKYAMNMGEFQIWCLEQKYEKGIELSTDELIKRFLAVTPLEEILVLYDILDNTNEKNIENVLSSLDKRRI